MLHVGHLLLLLSVFAREVSRARHDAILSGSVVMPIKVFGLDL